MVALNKFIGRTFPYAMQLDSGIYTPVYKKLTPEVLLKHLEGGHTIGSYVINEDDKITYICIDIDQDETITEPEKDPLYNVAIVVYDLFPDFDRCLEFSGRRGYHIWLFLEKPEGAKFYRELTKARLKRMGLRNIEIYPKQDTLKGKKLGNLIKLPLGIHKKSGQRSLILKEDKKC